MTPSPDLIKFMSYPKSSKNLYQPSWGLKAKPGLRLLHGNEASFKDGRSNTDGVVPGEQGVDLVLLCNDVA